MKTYIPKPLVVDIEEIDCANFFSGGGNALYELGPASAQWLDWLSVSSNIRVETESHLID